MKQKLFAVILSVILVLSLSACGNVSSNGYKTSGEWAMYDSNYMFAVEVDGFDGDVFSAGKYKFNLVAGRTKPATGSGLAVAPAIFEVYIGDKVYNSIAEMKQEIPEPQVTVGGMGSNDIVIEQELLAGQYVYIIPYGEVAYEPSGYIRFELVK